MTNNNTKVWLITGSSTGFGRILAEAVLKKGDRVIATARKPEQLQDLISQYPETAIALSLDVTKCDFHHKMSPNDKIYFNQPGR